MTAVGEEELRHSLGLAAHTTGKGKVALDPNTRPIEVFMCSVVSSVRRVQEASSTAGTGAFGSCIASCTVACEL